MRVIQAFFGELLGVFKGGLGFFGTLGFLGLLLLLVLIVYSALNPRTRTIALATLSSAFRFRFFWVMGVLLLLSVIGLPLMVSGDGTPEGLAQILINYTLSFAFFFMGVGTLWFSAGSMAGDIEDAQIQMIATKPVARWQIWLGKWMGITALNVMLLVLVYLAVLGMVEYKAKEMTANRLEELKLEVRWDDQNQSEVARDDLIFGMALTRKLDVFELDDNGSMILNEKVTAAERRRLQSSHDAIVFQRPDLAKAMNNFMNRHMSTNKFPLTKDSETLLNEIAKIRENRLRNRVLVGRASFSLKEVQRAIVVNQNQTHFMPREESLNREAMEADFKQRIKDVQKRLPELDANIIQAVSNQVRQAHMLATQKIEPKRGLQFQFIKPPGLTFGEKDKLILKLHFEDHEENSGSKKRHNFWVMYGNGNRYGIHKSAVGLTARTTHELLLTPHYYDHDGNILSYLSTNNIFKFTLINFPEQEVQSQQEKDRQVLKVPFLNQFDAELNTDNFDIQYVESSFMVNMLRAFGILLAWLGLLTAMGLTAACFMSFNVSAFACIVVLFMATWGTEQMKIVLEDETIMTTYGTDGERDSSILDWYALPMFSMAVPVLEAQRDYSPISDLSEGRSITWTELFKAYSFTWGIFGWLLGGMGAIIFTRRQLAITNSQT